MATKQVKKPIQNRVRRTKLQIEIDNKKEAEKINAIKERELLKAEKIANKKAIESLDNNSIDTPIENSIDTSIETPIENSIETPVEITETNIELTNEKINIGDFVSQINTKQKIEIPEPQFSENIETDLDSHTNSTDTDQEKTRKKRKSKDTDQQDQFLAQLTIFGLGFINDKLCNKIDKHNKDTDKYKFHEGAKQIMANKLSQTDISKVFDDMNPLVAFSIVAIGCTAINIARAFFDKEAEPPIEIKEDKKEPIVTPFKKTTNGK